MGIARNRTAYTIVDLGARQEPPADTHQEIAYAFPDQAGIDAVVETHLTHVLAQGTGKATFQIVFTCRSRVIRTPDGRLLARNVHRYQGPSLKVSASAEAQKKQILHSFQIGFESLAQDIVEETLLRAATLAARPHPELPEFLD